LSVQAQAAPAASNAPRPPLQLHSFPPHPTHEHDFADELVEVEDESQQRFKIFAVRHAAELTRASALLQRRYAWRGYSVQPLEERVRRRITLTASQDRSTVATITAGLDGSDGLYVERVYPDRVGELRRRGRTLCEFTKFAVDESVRSQALLGAIFHVACMYVLEVHRCTDALIEVNPRHVRFYEQMLGFRCVADERNDPSVQAPAVLMQLDLEYCAGEIVRLAGASSRGRRERSFYPHFFGPEVADEVVSRLRTH
jgi:hypothetical protein